MSGSLKGASSGIFCHPSFSVGFGSREGSDTNWLARSVGVDLSFSGVLRIR